MEEILLDFCRRLEDSDLELLKLQQFELVINSYLSNIQKVNEGEKKEPELCPECGSDCIYKVKDSYHCLACYSIFMFADF